MKNILLVAMCMMSAIIAKTQSVGIGNSNPDSSAILDLSNPANKGLLVPAMTTAQKAAIANPADGLLVYQTDSIPGFYYFDGIAWGRIGGGGNAWEETDSTVYTSKTVGIGNSSPDTSSILDLSNTDNKGVLIPSMTTAQKFAIADPASGLLVFQTDSIPGFYFYDALAWKRIGGGGNAWEETDSTVYTSKMVGIGNSSPDTSAILDLSNTENKGILIPSMTTAQKLVINNPANGLLVYQTDSIPGFYFYDGTAWGRIGGGGNAWEETDSTVYTSKFVGVNTVAPYNHLDVHGNMVITQPTITTESEPTPAQTITLINNSEYIYEYDSTGRFFDPGGPIGQYGANITNATCYIFWTNNTIGYELTVEEIDLGVGDSLIIRRNGPYGDILYALGNQNSLPGKYIINETTLYFLFESDASNSTLGDGFSILFKRLLSNPATQPPKGFAGNTIIFDAQSGSLLGGTIDNLAEIGENAFSYGYKNKSSGDHSIALGFNNISSGDNSFTSGHTNLSSGESSCAFGANNSSTAFTSIATGQGTEASGEGSFATGGYTQAAGELAVASGNSTIANGYASMVIGTFNSPILPSPQTAVTEDTPLFIIGNGNTSTDRSNAMVVRKDGHVGLGTNNPRITLHVADGTDAGLLDDDGFLLIGNANGINIVMDDNEIMARDNGSSSDLYLQKDGGKIFIGAPVSPSFLLSVNGTAGKNGGGSWSTYSDRRLKDNIRVYSDGLDAILKINPIWFQYNSMSGYDTKTKYVGVIAQELQEVSPYMVTTPAEPLADGSSGYLQVDNSAMTYMLINAVKELHAEIENLKSEIKELRKAK